MKVRNSRSRFLASIRAGVCPGIAGLTKFGVGQRALKKVSVHLGRCLQVWSNYRTRDWYRDW